MALGIEQTPMSAKSRAVSLIAQFDDEHVVADLEEVNDSALEYDAFEQVVRLHLSMRFPAFHNCEGLCLNSDTWLQLVRSFSAL